MREGQNLEWKTSWHDGHLKTACAFASSGSWRNSRWGLKSGVFDGEESEQDEGEDEEPLSLPPQS